MVSQGHQVVVIHRGPRDSVGSDPSVAGVDYRRADLTVASQASRVLDDCDFEGLFHLAAQASPSLSWRHPATVLRNNLIGQTNLLEAVRRRRIKPKVVIASSADIYGQVGIGEPAINEDAPLRPANPYALSKAAQDLQGLQYYLALGLPITRIRMFTQAGPGQARSYAVSDFAWQVANFEAGRRPCRLRVGNLENRRDYTDVRDMARALALTMERGEAGQAYNVGTGRTVRLRQIVEMLATMSKIGFDVLVDPRRYRPGDAREMLCDATRFRSLTGWQPQFDLRTTVADTLGYWRGRVSQVGP